MNSDLCYILCTTKLLNFAEESYLPFLDHTVCSKIEEWYRTNAPTAKIYRDIKNDGTLMYITWYIEFTDKADYTLFVLTR